MEQEIISHMEELRDNSPAKYLAMIASFHVVAGLDSMCAPPNGYTRGDFKRAIRVIRATQKDSERRQDLVSILETAVTLIRREWLHR